MGLFNWFRWQLERRTMQLRIDSLVGDLNQLIQEVTELRIASHEAQLLLHDAERGAKLAAEEQDKLKTQLELARSAAGYWETQATSYKQRISGLNATAEKFRDENEILRQQANTTEPAESELERKAWELWLRGDDSIESVWRKAELWLRARESKRNEQERLTDEQ